MARPQPVVMAADFETTTDPNDCRVWAFGHANIQDPKRVTVGNDLLEFFQDISAIGSSIIYFHNLKFDGTFMIDWLLKKLYQYTDERRLQTKEFTTLFSKMGKLYSIRVSWGKNKVTEFRDSVKKLPMPLAEVAKAFNLPVMKGSIDYDAPREVGHELTLDEYEYVYDDVYILAEALRQTYDEGMTRLTVGSDAMEEFKSMFGKKQFRKYFPVLADDLDSAIRRAYRGGYTYADKRFKGRKLNQLGVVLDVNSLYPYVMREKTLPFGDPVPFNGRPPENDMLKIFTVTFTAKLKRNHLPIIQVKKSFQFHESEYLDTISDPVTLTVTDIDWALYNEHYKIDVVSWEGGHMFRHRRGFFDEYIDKWMEVKATTTGGARVLAKLRLNSLYGKFGTSRDVTGKYPEIEDGAVKWRLAEDEEERDPVYIPMGVYITAYARELTVKAAQQNYDTFAYADTDSLHLLRPDIPDTIDVHPSRLGAWKHEYDFTEAFYLRAKAYAERTTEGEMVVRIAGLPVSVSKLITFDQIYDGNVIHGKLVPRNVPGGVVLVPSPYELKM